MATPASTPPLTGPPPEPVPVAVLARTSTKELQDPVASLRRQITSTREWLPTGFFITAYFWDIESGALDLDQRGHSHYDQYVAEGLPRDGGLADLLDEARSPSPRFSVVVVEDIERASRDTFNSLKLERELSEQGIPLFATDEPADIAGVNPTTILVRRVKQGVAEWFRLQLKIKARKGLREHTDAGWNIGKVPYGYLAERIRHPNPSKAAQGLTKTRLVLDPDHAPVIEQIYAWRVEDKLAVNSIVTRLNADRASYPPPDPRGGWTIGGVAAMLRNPKYTGHQVFGRTQHGRPVPAEQWHWSPEPTHPAIIGKDTWAAAQTVGAEHATSRDDTIPHPSARRTYILRSRIRCKICQRRKVGVTRTHKERGPKGDYAYYVCTHDRANPRHVAAAPDHPGTVAARQDLILTALRGGLEAYAFTPGRKERLKKLLPAGADDHHSRTKAQATALGARVKQLETAMDNLTHDLATIKADPDDSAAQDLRARIYAHFTDLHHDHEAAKTQLQELSQQAPPSFDLDLIDDLPLLPGRVHELPERLQAGIFAALDIQILWNAPMKQATFIATITGTTGSTLDYLLTCGDDPTITGTDAPNTSTTSDYVSGLARHPIVHKSLPKPKVHT